MEHASQLGKYYIHMEDDTPPVPAAWGEIDKFIRLLESEAKMMDKSAAMARLRQSNLYTHDEVLHDNGFFLLRLCNEKLVF